MNLDREDLELHGNPVLQETVKEFLQRQKQLLADNPDFAANRYECRQCGDCCRWNYYSLNVNEARFIDRLVMLEKYPHGYWVIGDGKINCYMPLVKKQEMFHFDGPLPEKHIKFLEETGRLHGYWVYDTNSEKIMIYNPTPCINLTESNLCKIYETRPQVCREYMCGRHPVKED